ncbi:hypothetical protein M8J77_019287 [Diaphorina citri]|nr:hypothetical protein M8J77_019287 [Diaphorina citri]
MTSPESKERKVVTQLNSQARVYNLTLGRSDRPGSEAVSATHGLSVRRSEWPQQATTRYTHRWSPVLKSSTRRFGDLSEIDVVFNVLSHETSVIYRKLMLYSTFYRH